ncbi:endonuclease domain-containing protein [Gracilimonas sediminicola]|uniref:Endonuclease domain-containing protein n=1 Tax=Gracilimonas sediminicola TaxID=2952158 RepID=A0A9X2RDU8_9BACT|nr:endonuclease domain-containing protein [Gracilimonas sediminicola]MCP9291536.1 endonuclease domain-containing protein [Gracilimonas sediminicola]
MKKRIPIIPYREDLIAKARWLRKNSTPGEIEIWKAIKNKKLLGYKFRRQRPIHRFIVDFYCRELRLAIEIDGRSHDYKIEYDKQRQEIIEQLGVSFLRFSESDAKHYTESVVMEIERWILEHK